MNQRIAKFDSLNEEVVDQDFLFYYLRSRAFLDVLYPTANGTRQANLSSVTIKTLSIPLCPVGKQKATHRTSSISSSSTSVIAAGRTTTATAAASSTTSPPPCSSDSPPPRSAKTTSTPTPISASRCTSLR